jgi:DNA primase
MSKGIQFLLDRGISEDTIKTFNLGYYGDSKLQTISGAMTSEQGKYFKSLMPGPVPPETVSRFENCVVFPLTNIYGSVVSIFARRLEGKPKFVALSFDKSRMLYGLDRTHSMILNRNHVYITEGIFDFLMLWQCGIRNSVCALGCRLAYEQMCLLARFTDKFTLIFDSDTAGKDGMIAAKKQVEKYGYKGSITILPEGLDLDDFLLKHGVEEFLKHAAKNSTEVQGGPWEGGL